MTQDEMVRWHHRLNGHEFQQTPGDDEGQGSLGCCSPWCCKESDATEGLNNNNNCIFFRHNAIAHLTLHVLSHVQLCNPTDCRTPGSSVHGIPQARILQWVAMPSSRGSSQPRDQT